MIELIGNLKFTFNGKKYQLHKKSIGWWAVVLGCGASLPLSIGIIYCYLYMMA